MQNNLAQETIHYIFALRRTNKLDTKNAERLVLEAIEANLTDGVLEMAEPLETLTMIEDGQLLPDLATFKTVDDEIEDTNADSASKQEL